MEKEGVIFFTFPNLAKYSDIRHGVFTRSGGYSQQPFRSLNVSVGIGDDDGIVQKNRSVISRCIGEKDIVFANQNHDTNVLVFKNKDETGTSVAFNSPRTGDAMVTNISNKFLAIQMADCQSVMLYEPKMRVIANIHTGWRGSIKNIIGCTVAVMEKVFKCPPRRMIAGIGPSLGPCCAEFRNYKQEIPKVFWKYKKGSNHFDFWSMSADQLSRTGVLNENINISGMCTQCNTDLFFSYRGEKVTGRFAALIGLT